MRSAGYLKTGRRRYLERERELERFPAGCGYWLLPAPAPGDLWGREGRGGLLAQSISLLASSAPSSLDRTPPHYTEHRRKLRQLTENYFHV